MTEIDKRLRSTVYGTVAEYRVICELLDRGHEVAIPVVDHGVDIVVDYSIRVQVKSSFLSGKGPTYAFNFNSRTDFKKLDFYIFVGREPDRTWVIPIKELLPYEGTRGVSIPGNPRSCPGRRGRPFVYESLWKFEDRWDLLK